MKRRNFLKIFPSAALSPIVVNGLQLRPFANSTMARIMGNCDGIDERALVLIRLKGGNDGLNMLIPVAQYDTYANLRPTVKIPDSGADQFLQLDNTLPDDKKVGLHPAMTALKALYDNGWVNVVQGVGYENPNQSHFKSTDLWMSGGDGTPENFNIPSGWMGRALQALYPEVLGVPTNGMPDPLGIQLGDPNPSLGFHTETEHQNVINLSGQDGSGFYSLVQTIGGAPLANIPDSDMGDEIAYIMGVEQSVGQYAQRISEVFNAGSNALSYPDTDLGNQLKTIARLIKGGSKTKIYLCLHEGFDTHSSQVAEGGTALDGSHAQLLFELAEALKAFYDDMEAMGIADKAVSCTFSEFGRCAAENGSFGTDHGTLAPMLIVGKAVSAGVTGTNVNLSNLTNDNQVQNMQHDYRQVFTTLLQDWLGANQMVLEETMFDSYMKIPLVSATYTVDPDCYYGGTTATQLPGKPGADRLRVFPNPARFSTEAVFEAGNTFLGRLTVHNMAGVVVYSGNVKVQQGTNLFQLDVSNWNTGYYVVRLEDRNSGSASVSKLTVVR